MRPISSQLGIELAFVASKDKPDIMGNALLLREALQNLIDNAFRHGGPEVTFIEAGTKISADAAAFIFARFAQGSESDDSRLGPTIIQETDSLYAGYLELVEEIHTIFWTVLPKKPG